MGLEDFLGDLIGLLGVVLRLDALGVVEELQSRILCLLLVKCATMVV